jgi:hypothetical protein
MSSIIKKIGRKILLVFILIGGFFAFLLSRIFIGGSGNKLSELDSKAKDVLDDCCSITSVAEADVPYTCASCVSGDGGDGY